MTTVLLDSTQYFIGHSTNDVDRYRASSGGIGTAITRYLLSLPDFDTGITFCFDSNKCMYVPKLIHSEQDINVCGSIYQDIDILRFLRNNLEKIRGGIVVTSPPCQVTAIRQLLTKQQIRHFIISYCCSGQTTVEGTWKYYELLGIEKSQVKNMQYRGNGWPSGIQIWLKDGSKIYKDNYTEPWVTLKQSRLYQPTRCFYCTRDTGRNADIALADPWLKKYKEDEIGNTLLLINTEWGKRHIKEMSDLHLINVQPSCYDDYSIAQRPNIQKEISVRNQTKYLRFTTYIIQNPRYKIWATRSRRNMSLHTRLFIMIKEVKKRRNMKEAIRNRMEKIQNKIRTYLTVKKLGGGDSTCCIHRNVTITVPKCIFLGSKVGIGENTYLGPVTQYAGITYNPKIRIGSGTWIGKNCSIAAIHGVTIGENVLFAGQVHITDHSHGYEDISIPITRQALISKGSIVIEDDCWLGFSCEILSGVHIGKHSIVAARSVVTKDVPAYSIVAGNPAKIIKQYNQITQKWERINK